MLGILLASMIMLIVTVGCFGLWASLMRRADRVDENIRALGRSSQ